PPPGRVRQRAAAVLQDPRAHREARAAARAGRPAAPDIAQRTKQPYRSPDSSSFFFDGKPLDYVEDLLSEASIREAGYFDAAAVGRLFEKCRAGRARGFSDNQAFVGVLSTMLVHRQLRGFRTQSAAGDTLSSAPLAASV